LLLLCLWHPWHIYRYTLVLLEVCKLYQMSLKSEPGNHGDADDFQLPVDQPLGSTASSLCLRFSMNGSRRPIKIPGIE